MKVSNRTAVAALVAVAVTYLVAFAFAIAWAVNAFENFMTGVGDALTGAWSM